MSHTVSKSAASLRCTATIRINVAVDKLEQKVAWLVALEEIRRVIALYAKAGDDNNNPDLLAPLFDDEARWCCDGFGEFFGRDNITRELAAVGRERILWSLHYPRRANYRRGERRQIGACVLVAMGINHHA